MAIKFIAICLHKPLPIQMKLPIFIQAQYLPMIFLHIDIYNSSSCFQSIHLKITEIIVIAEILNKIHDTNLMFSISTLERN